jgi:hypothetical protein
VGSGLPSLVEDGHNRASMGTWSRGQRRSYHSLRSFTRYWSSLNYQLVRVDVTTVVGDLENRAKLATHHRELIRAVERHFGYEGIQHVQVRTSEGGGVIHAVWAIPPGRHFYVGQAWLSKWWLDHHGAHRVWIQRMGRGEGNRRRVCRYVAEQYIAGQVKRDHCSWSHRRMGFPLKRTWREFKARWWALGGVDPRGMVAGWESLLSGRRVSIAGSGEVWSLESVRRGLGYLRDAVHGRDGPGVAIARETSVCRVHQLTLAYTGTP